MIKSLTLSNFRGFESASLSFNSNSIVLIGENGQGKSTLLEAIYLLSNLRSFRTSNMKEMRRIGTDVLSASCDILRTGAWTTKLELKADSVSKQLKVDGIPVSKASDFVRKFKTVAFLPDDPILVSGPSQMRRRFMDMFISMVSQDYFLLIQRYFSALRSKNFMLKSGKFDEEVMKSFDSVMASAGARVNKERRFFISKLSGIMAQNAAEIRPELSSIKLKLKCPIEYDSEETFYERIDKDLQKDRLKGFASFGPHLDDFEISVDSKNLRNYGSRGQCRIAALCLKLAEFELVMASSSGSDAVVLVDDSTGDLDQRAKDAFYGRMAKAGQVVYAFTANPDGEALKNAQRFYVHDGKITTE